LVVGASGEASLATGVDGDQEQSDDGTDAGAAYVFVRDAQGEWKQQAYLKASNTGEGDRFGFSVAIDGDTIVVGAHGEDGSATGVDGTSNESAADAGAAYVFERSETEWKQTAYLKASNTGVGDNFGWSVAVSGDTIVVGAPREDSAATGVDGDETSNGAGNSGAAYVFVRANGEWFPKGYLKSSNSEVMDSFGWSVSIGGETIAIGAPREDGASRGVNGDQTSDAAPDSGAAYVFLRRNDAWSQQAYVKASNTGSGDVFGWAVALDRETLVVGAPVEDGGATQVDGNAFDETAPNSGAAYVFARRAGRWSQQAYLKGSKSQPFAHFGYAVGVWSDGVVVGAPAWLTGEPPPEADLTYLFTRSTGTWAEAGATTGSNSEKDDEFGAAVAIHSDLVAVGALGEDGGGSGVNGDEGQQEEGSTTSGAAYVFR
jgi:trimeric autotransporter adhesin